MSDSSSGSSSSLTLLLGLLLALLLALARGPLARADAPATVASDSPSGSVGTGAGDFLAVAEVLQSPRCQNCHPSDDRPRVGDTGRRHRMNVSRLSMTSGLPCTACHRGQNAPVPHSPPGMRTSTGEPGWRMPGAESPMVFEGRTPHELCEQLKDPARNGGKTLDALREHFAHDPLVLWGWSPGPGRTLPPMTHEQLMKHVEAWLAAGAPCPAS